MMTRNFRRTCSIMHVSASAAEEAMAPIDFRTEPARYRHWKIQVDGEIAFLVMDVDPAGGPSGDYELKLNSYRLAVDIELHEPVQRLPFQQPHVRRVGI